jgi:hypothetical protein
MVPSLKSRPREFFEVEYTNVCRILGSSAFKISLEIRVIQRSCALSSFLNWRHCFFENFDCAMFDKFVVISLKLHRSENHVFLSL